MSGSSTHYGLVKPTVGGSENEWGGNLNDDLDKIDGLLGGDEPINGIDIDSGTIDGGVIVGEIGKEPGEGEDPTSIHPSTEISGKVKRLVGMDDPDGVITNCDVTTRELTVTESITEQVKVHSPSEEITFKVKDGTMHYLPSMNTNQEFNLIFTLEPGKAEGQAMTLMIDWLPTDGSPNSVVWGGAIKWIGGGPPDWQTGTNVVQVWAVSTGTGVMLFGAGAGTAS